MMLEEMSQRVRPEGHASGTSEVLFDIDDEEKDQSLFLHSEKLAVAFGLRSTAPGTSTRITKNLRVCSDCHSFLEAVSKVFRRASITQEKACVHARISGSYLYIYSQLLDYGGYGLQTEVCNI